jgi:small subunit ribosomal protein S10
VAIQQRIKVRFKAYDYNLLDQTVREIVNAVNRTGAAVEGPIPLPTRRQIVTVLRSPHVDKKSQESFETREHKRLMYIIDPSPQTMDALMKLDISAGVDISMKQD